MRKFNQKIKTVYKELTNEKEKFGSFHKALIHIHTPASHDFKLFSDWSAKRYSKATDLELYELFFKDKTNLKQHFPLETLDKNIDKSYFSDFKEYVSYLFLAEKILINNFEIVVVTDHNTTAGVHKLRKAISILKEGNNVYEYYPHVFCGVEISAADKLHIVGIFDDSKKKLVDEWLEENLLSEKEGSYQHSLTIMNFFKENNILNYIAHFNTSNIFKKKAHLSGAYKKSLLVSDNIKFMGVNNPGAIPGLDQRLARDFSCKPDFILDNDAHDIDSLNKNIMWLKGGRISFGMFEEALLDYTVSVSLTEPSYKQISYIKGIYVENRGGDRSFLIGNKDNKAEDFYLTFSPSLNCLIGGRGTGKSTIIDMLQYVLSQDCNSLNKLEFICEHTNAFVLYVLDNEEYIIEVSLPDVKQEGKDNILQYYGQNREGKYPYTYRFDSLTVKNLTRSLYTKVYKVAGEKFNPVIDKDRILNRMFDRRYSVNELVRTADGEKITEFISELMLRNKHLPEPSYGLKTQSLKSFASKIQELNEYRDQRRETILSIINDFNDTQIGKLRICYEQGDIWGEPKFEEALFQEQSDLSHSFEHYRVSQQDVVDILYLAYNDLGMEKFVECLVKQDIPDKYFILLKNISADNFISRPEFWRDFKEIDELAMLSLKAAIYSLVEKKQLLAELKRILQDYIASERLYLEFNINSKETSRQLDEAYKEVSVLSLGQKVVAMLDFILAYSEYSKDFRPLIIDQPEDNLDNRYIYSHLVNQFRSIKNQRQIILATHNATIVTNSMTDQVIIMESDGYTGWIDAKGYVSEKFIKNHIINQLEGGKDSFRHKMSIYETALVE